MCVCCKQVCDYLHVCLHTFSQAVHYALACFVCVCIHSGVSRRGMCSFREVSIGVGVHAHTVVGCAFSCGSIFSSAVCMGT